MRNRREILADRARIALLEAKDAEIRIKNIKQGLDAVDKGIHMGGAMSAVVPMVSLYYGGMMNFDVGNPTAVQDMFVLSKGHAVATLASVYADLGYFADETLVNSRSYASILNGHPGPLLPGVHLPTGPMGQGICVACGLAAAGKRGKRFDVFVLTGDGEMQEGTVWEAVTYAGANGLDNLCVLVDKNQGQLDDPSKNTYSMNRLAAELKAFGFSVLDIDGTSYVDMIESLERFKYERRGGRPTAIISNCRKGSGTFARDYINHKVTLKPESASHEISLYERLRRMRIDELESVLGELRGPGGGTDGLSELAPLLRLAGMEAVAGEAAPELRRAEAGVKTRPARKRDKKVAYDMKVLPSPEARKNYTASDVVTEAMKVFARDEKVVSVDADLGTTSGLESGVGSVDRTRALNAGIAEANMMCMGEAFAILGYNAWVSTFCPFFNWNVLRRIGMNQQERMEVIQSEGGWLTEGHTLDLTFLATAPNFETKTNGATHMGNDDTFVFKNIPFLKIIDTCCPRQLLSIMRWIMDGGKGLVYLRILRSDGPVLYEPELNFEYGRGYSVVDFDNPDACIVSSGRQVHEALAVSQSLAKEGLHVDVVDMPSFDPALVWTFHEKKIPLIVAEQNNGRIWSEVRRVVFNKGGKYDPQLLVPVNTREPDGTFRFIHSATYSELTDAYGLSAPKLSEMVRNLVKRK